MDENIRAYAQRRLTRAYEDLVAARDSLELGHYRAAVSRSYYAIFNLASAALLTRQVERAKHSGVQSAFGQFLVKPGLVEPEYGRIYQRARELREDADYKDEVTLDAEAAQCALKDA